MPRFSESGADMYICQSCGRDLPSDTQPPTWVAGKGNICPTCKCTLKSPAPQVKSVKTSFTPLDTCLNGSDVESLQEALKPFKLHVTDIGGELGWDCSGLLLSDQPLTMDEALGEAQKRGLLL